MISGRFGVPGTAAGIVPRIIIPGASEGTLFGSSGAAARAHATNTPRASDCQKKLKLADDSWRHQNSNALNESVWDAQGVEMEACASFDIFHGSVNF